jgi:NADPH:quinone reductase-like Zn-dependent oxidoreductase
MKAMQFDAFGGLASLHDVQLADPVPAVNEVLVEVAASSVNPIDWKLRAGFLRWLSPLRFSRIPCFDFAGTVRARGTEASGFEIGVRVVGMRSLYGTGAAAERVVATEDQLVTIPATVAFEQAAGLPLAGMTALQALRYGQGAANPERVLVVGASGGVGHYAVQIAKAQGAEVTAVCSTANVEWVRALGADCVLDYTRGETATPRSEFDRVLDAVSLGPFAHWRRWLRPDGVYVTLLPRLDLLAHLLLAGSAARRKATVIGLKPNRADLQQLVDWMADGRLKTVVDSRYDLADLAAAFKRSRSGRVKGKIVVAVAG